MKGRNSCVKNKFFQSLGNKTELHTKFRDENNSLI